MSRCMQFPPPGYVWKGASGEALIELMKAKREKAEAKNERKEKRRRLKEKEEELEEGEIKQNKRHRRHSHECGKKEIQERADNGWKKKDEILEKDRSNLTEELGQPISGSIYDSSGNSEKIKSKGHCCSTSNVCHHYASIIRTDFKDPEEKSRGSICSTTVSTTGRKTETCTASGFSASSQLQTELQLIRDLITNWVPPLLEKVNEAKFDDQECLRYRRLPIRCMSRTSNSKDEELNNGSFILYPCARYLPEGDIHALPYTIPF